MNRSEQMEEALKAIRDINDSRPHDAKGYEINDIIAEALALPRRNCDVGDLKQQSKRFGKFCRYHVRELRVGEDMVPSAVCLKCPIDSTNRPDDDRSFMSCGVDWSQMPYEGDSSYSGKSKRGRRLGMTKKETEDAREKEPHSSGSRSKAAWLN